MVQLFHSTYYLVNLHQPPGVWCSHLDYAINLLISISARRHVPSAWQPEDRYPIAILLYL